MLAALVRPADPETGAIQWVGTLDQLGPIRIAEGGSWVIESCCLGGVQSALATADLTPAHRREIQELLDEVAEAQAAER